MQMTSFFYVNEWCLSCAGDDLEPVIKSRPDNVLEAAMAGMLSSSQQKERNSI